MMINSHEQERQYRLSLGEQLIAAGGPRNVSAILLRSLGIFGGAQGIWVHKTRTHLLTPDLTGVTVAVLHTGTLSRRLIRHRYALSLSTSVAGWIINKPASNAL